MRNIVVTALKLFIITAIASALLGLTYSVTKAPIADANQKASDAANQSVLADATTFEEVPLDAFASQPGYDASFSNVTKLFEGEDAGGQPVGYVFKVETKGYGGTIVMTVGLGVDGNYTGITIDSHAETPGLGANATQAEWQAQFAGKSAAAPLTVSKTASGDQIQALTGATITSKAVASGVDLAGSFYNALLAQQ